MRTSDLDRYCEKAMREGAAHARVIHPGTVVTAPWVRFKCLYGCPYRHRYSCPPHTPTPEETRKVLDAYSRAILYHAEAPSAKERRGQMKAYLDMLVRMEGELFKDGYYKAFVMTAGPCTLCTECGLAAGLPCRQPEKLRPSMESCGIDVFQTARNSGFPLATLREKTETRNIYCLMLVD